MPTNHRPQPSLPPIPGDVDPPPPDRDVLARYQARVLEPQDAVRMDARTIRPTAYVAAELLIPADANISRLVSKAAENLGLRISDNIDQPPTGIQRGRGVQRLRLEPDRRAVKPDAWEVLETARALARQPGPDVQASSAGPGSERTSTCWRPTTSPVPSGTPSTPPAGTRCTAWTTCCSDRCARCCPTVRCFSCQRPGWWPCRGRCWRPRTVARSPWSRRQRRGWQHASR